jgi:hypothetical protein
MAVPKLPALHFYVQDYLADTRALSNELKGFYVDLLCYMHKSSRRGYLNQANGKPYSPEDLGMMTGTTAERAAHLLLGLINSEVISATHQGIPFSRRMVRDEKKRLEGIRNGKRGGNPTLKKGVNPPGYPFTEDEDERSSSSSPGGDPRGGLRVRTVLAAVDPGNLLPAPPDPPNLPATAAALKVLSAKDEFWDPLIRIFGLEPKTMTDENRLWQQCVDFRTKGATVAEVERRAANYRLHFSTAFTPKAVLSNWEILKDPPIPKPQAGERPRKTSQALT